MSSIAFDPAAEYYDQTRALPRETHAAVIGGLLGELRGRGSCLEIGVGTGRIALDLCRGGVAMTGVDLSRAMLRKLVEKAGGGASFPLAVADATALPFRSAAFDAAVACHVLHLIPAWRLAVAELVRVVRPGGVILYDPGGSAPGVAREVRRHFFSRTWLGSGDRPGLTDAALLDDLMAARGARTRSLPPVVLRVENTIEDIVRRLERGIFAGCWRLSDDERRAAAEATREWAADRYGPLDRPRPVEVTMVWRAYDLPV